MVRTHLITQPTVVTIVFCTCQELDSSGQYTQSLEANGCCLCFGLLLVGTRNTGFVFIAIDTHLQQTNLASLKGQHNSSFITKCTKKSPWTESSSCGQGHTQSRARTGAHPTDVWSRILPAERLDVCLQGHLFVMPCPIFNEPVLPTHTITYQWVIW